MVHISIIGAVAALVANVAAHGAVTSYEIAGKTYPGYVGCELPICSS